MIFERSTQSFWVGYAAAEVVPVVARLREMILASTRIFADEIVVPVLDPGRGRSKQGYFWAMARHDRPWARSQQPGVVYSYAPGRGHIHADALLGSYRGILWCDGYAADKKFGGYKSADPPAPLAFCWSHVRRGFYNLAKATTRSLYPTSSGGRKRWQFVLLLSAPRTCFVRQRRGDTGIPQIGPPDLIGRAMHDLLCGQMSRSDQLADHMVVTPSAAAASDMVSHSPFFSADLQVWMPYRRRNELTRCAVHDFPWSVRMPILLSEAAMSASGQRVARLRITTSASSGVRALCSPVLSFTKNSLFADSDEGGENWACLASLIETCKHNGANPQAYFTDLLTRLVNG